MAKGHGGHSGHTGRGSGSKSSTPMTNEAASRIQSAGAGKNCRQLAHVSVHPKLLRALRHQHSPNEGAR